MNNTPEPEYVEMASAFDYSRPHSEPSNLNIPHCTQKCPQFERGFCKLLFDDSKIVPPDFNYEGEKVIPGQLCLPQIKRDYTELKERRDSMRPVEEAERWAIDCD